MGEPPSAESRDASDPPEQKPLRRAVLDALLGLVKLLGLFVPEIVVAVLGLIVGLVIGIVVGVGATSELFSGPGVWARAGPIALIFPLLTSLGPPLLGALLGLVIPPALILPPHALVVGVIARHAYRDRYVVLWSVAATVWMPALFFVAYGVRGALGTALVLSPLTAGFGFVAGALFVAVRGVLDGRSLGQFWRNADGSMVLAMVVLTAYGVLVTWLVCVLFCLLPTVPIALSLAIALAARLIAKKNHEGLAITTLIINTLHLALLVFAIVAMTRERPPARDRARLGLRLVGEADSVVIGCAERQIQARPPRVCLRVERRRVAKAGGEIRDVHVDGHRALFEV